jgi:hypothetical protein
MVVYLPVLQPERALSFILDFAKNLVGLRTSLETDRAIISIKNETQGLNARVFFVFGK